MAIMFNCAHDWSFDQFVADCNSYKALPIKGVYCRRGASDNEVFIATLKRICNEYIADNTQRFTYVNERNGYTHVDYEEMGEWLWSYLCHEIYISDWYKDVYNQRPHLDKDLYLWALGYHDMVNTLLWRGMSFRTMDDIINDYERSAKRVREYALSQI